MTEPHAEHAQYRQLIAIVLFAVVLRLVYQAAMLRFGGSFDNGSDSGKYIEAANAILAAGQWPDTDRLPAYILMVASLFKAAGGESLRTVVTVQAVLDGLSVLAIALTAKSLSSRLVIPAALIAAVIPNFVAHSAYILQESLFTVFFTWGLCALFHALRSARPPLLLLVAGLLFGLTLWNRLTLIYYAVPLTPALLFALRQGGRRGWLESAAFAIIPAAAMSAVISPLAIYNYLTYGQAELSSQSGEHILRWVYACLATPWPCADRPGVLAKLDPIIAAYAATGANVHQISAYEKKMALDGLKQLPLWQIAWGMIWGAFRNTFQTSFYFVIGQFKQPETYVTAMPGKHLYEKIAAFAAQNYKNPFMDMWVIAQVTLLLSRVVQLAGIFVGLKDPRFRGATILLIVTIAYILALNGPIANPKYRVPCEPAFIILTAMGLVYWPWRAPWRRRTAHAIR